MLLPGLEAYYLLWIDVSRGFVFCVGGLLVGFTCGRLLYGFDLLYLWELVADLDGQFVR